MYIVALLFVNNGGRKRKKEKKRKTYIYLFKKKKSSALFTFSYPCNGRESIVLGSNFRNGDFDGFTRYEVP